MSDCDNCPVRDLLRELLIKKIYHSLYVLMMSFRHDKGSATHAMHFYIESIQSDVMYQCLNPLDWYLIKYFTVPMLLKMIPDLVMDYATVHTLL